MNTKVKGDKIKEGSIPLSALNDEVKDKIENAGGGADWNAQEGEAGYIENKPFEIQKLNELIFSDFEKHPYGIEIPSHTQTIKIETKYGFDECSLSKLQENLLNSDYWYVNNVLGDFEYGSMTVYLYDDGTLAWDIDDYDVEVPLINVYAIGEYFVDNNIPDIVIKTTPQTLNDTDKNQALANLGIADLLEALKPVKLSGNIPVGNVTQEQLDEIGLTDKVITCICNGYTRTIVNRGIPYSVIQAYMADFNDYEIIIANYLFDDSGDIYGLSQYKIECMGGVCKIYCTDI